MVSLKIHFDEIDIYKGIAILLIIFGHSFCLFPVDFTNTDLIYIQSMIGSFNLNMFFVASGILFSIKESWRVFLMKKTKRLVIPWVTFTFVALFLKNLFSAFVHSQSGCVLYELLLDVICGKSYWFLYALVLMMIVTRAIKNRTALTIVLGGILIAQYILKGYQPEYDVLCFSRFIHYYPWFIAGFLMKEVYPFLIGRVSRWNVYILLAVAIFFLSIPITAVILGLKKFFMIKSILLPIAGCKAFWFLSIIFARGVNLKLFFAHFGKYSLQYYLNHLLIMLACYYVGARIFDESHLGALFIIFACAVLVSWIMLLIEKKISIVRKLCGLI